MSRLRRHAWWGLLAVSVLVAIFGVTDIAAGAAADVGIPQGLTGRTIEELEQESADAYRMFDFGIRTNGWTLAVLGTLLSILVLIPFRRGERWAWWALWALPIWAAVVPIFYLVAGVRADQPPPPPMVSGPIIAALCAAILFLAAPPPRENDARSLSASDPR
jgi:peptidoglycan/LPS O-acetylase OafA/YrhL